MHNLLKRFWGRILHTLSDESIRIQMLLHPVNLLKPENAETFLLGIAADLGGTCIINRPLDYEKRSVLLSVIVPTYNAERYIKGCLDSLLKQVTSFDYEVIVVNDGSTDKTSVRLKEYEQNTAIRVLHQENRGASAARNLGIACAKGEYLCFVDSDDELAEGAMEAWMTTAVRENAKLVIGSQERCLRNGTVIKTLNLKSQKVTDGVLPGFAAGRIIHYSVFRNLCFPEGYWFEDSIMAQIVHPMCQDATYTISDVCYKYFVNEAGMTSIAQGKPKSLDSLWITKRLLQERKAFQLELTQRTFTYFLSMVNLTYHRTKYLGVEVAQAVFVVQRMLLDKYYSKYQTTTDGKKRKIEKALRTNDFRRYILACESKER